MKKLVFLISCFFFTNIIFSQDLVDEVTLYYSKTFNKCSENEAVYYINYKAIDEKFTVYKNSFQPTYDAWHEEVFKMDGTPVSSGNFVYGYYDGEWKRYNNEGKLIEQTTYRNGTKLNTIEYFPSGKVSYKENKWYYESGKLKKEKVASKDQKIIEISYYETGEIKEKEYFEQNKSIADTSFFESGAVRKIKHYNDSDNFLNKSDNYTIFFENGKINETKEEINDTTYIKVYNENGDLYKERRLVDNKTIFEKNFLETSDSISEAEIYTIVEEMPRFKNCMLVKTEEVEKCTNVEIYTSIAKNVVYPPYAIENDIQAKEYISFIVDENGKVTDVESKKGSNSVLTEQAIRIVQSLPDFKPGYQRGKAAKVSYVIPVNFRLQ
ncbi:MAG: TonB family protein [Chitinophagales bacterium]|nr:TonB family protein [Chitinophagales bacterium]